MLSTSRLARGLEPGSLRAKQRGTWDVLLATQAAELTGRCRGHVLRGILNIDRRDVLGRILIGRRYKKKLDSEAGLLQTLSA